MGPSPFRPSRAWARQLARRHRDHLGRRSGACCQAASYSSGENEEPPLAIDGPALPLALGANRFTEARRAVVGPPLQECERCRGALLKTLEALP